MHSSVLPITVIIAAKNEAINIGRCFDALEPVARIIVLDSQSTDGTAEIACARGAEVIQFHYAGGYPKKRQWALDTLDIDTKWILLLDADEVVPKELWEEIAEVLQQSKTADAYLITKGFHFLGRRFRFGGFSHAAVLLFRNGKACFEQLIQDSAGSLDMEVHERLHVEGRVGQLKTPLIHDDYKGLEAYIDRHNRYSTWEARVRYSFLSGRHFGPRAVEPRLFGNTQERRRFLKRIAMRIPFEPILWFLYHFVFRLGLLEGRPGLIASQIRANYIAQVHAKIYEMQHARDAESMGPEVMPAYERSV